MRTLGRVSFPEAKKRVQSRLLRPRVTYASAMGKFITRRPLSHVPDPAPTTQSSSPTPFPNQVETMITSVQQKRSRSEDSIEGSLPAKAQPPKPTPGPVQATVVTVVAASTVPKTVAALRPMASGAKVAGSSQPTPAPTSSGYSNAQEWKLLGGRRTGNLSQASTLLPGKPSTSNGKGMATMTCPQLGNVPMLSTATAKSVAGAGKALSRDLPKRLPE